VQQDTSFEIKMSKPRLDRVERRDGRLQYNPMTIAELQKMTPAINWKDHFAGIGFQKFDTVIVSQPKYMTIANNLSENNVSAWKEYMKWTLLNGSNWFVVSTVDAANFDFYGKTLTGAIKQKTT
jgi:endothelin-converting enzyme/putative endopeptidase